MVLRTLNDNKTLQKININQIRKKSYYFCKYIHSHNKTTILLSTCFIL